jgi:hypothetical protein
LRLGLLPRHRFLERTCFRRAALLRRRLRPPLRRSPRDSQLRRVALGLRARRSVHRSLARSRFLRLGFLDQSALGIGVPWFVFRCGLGSGFRTAALVTRTLAPGL